MRTLRAIANSFHDDTNDENADKDVEGDDNDDLCLRIAFFDDTWSW